MVKLGARMGVAERAQTVMTTTAILVLLAADTTARTISTNVAHNTKMSTAWLGVQTLREHRVLMVKTTIACSPWLAGCGQTLQQDMHAALLSRLLMELPHAPQFERERHKHQSHIPRSFAFHQYLNLLQSSGYIPMLGMTLNFRAAKWAY
jgi:hypothetical protein